MLIVDSLTDQSSSLLDTINSPRNLRRLSLPEMAQLAQELRETIITTVSQTGGHLAPSLGVVELSIALHYVFDTPRDRLVWDVGHQAYAHKLLTGRREQFATLRQYKGMSGFPKRGEKPLRYGRGRPQFDLDLLRPGHGHGQMHAKGSRQGGGHHR